MTLSGNEKNSKSRLINNKVILSLQSSLTLLILFGVGLVPTEVLAQSVPNNITGTPVLRLGNSANEHSEFKIASRIDLPAGML